MFVIGYRWEIERSFPFGDLANRFWHSE